MDKNVVSLKYGRAEVNYDTLHREQAVAEESVQNLNNQMQSAGVSVILPPDGSGTGTTSSEDSLRITRL